MTKLRYPFNPNICTACKTRYAMHNDTLCGACAEAADEPDKTYCTSCHAVHGTYKRIESGHMARTEVLSNGYCRKCWWLRKQMQND